MSDIQVRVTPADDGYLAEVTVRDRGREERHRVRVPRADAEARVRASGAFLLEREPKESILREFDIVVIARYFPEYPEEIRRWLAG